MKIPKISLDTVESTSASILNHEDCWSDTAERIMKENPVLYELLVITSKGPDSDDFKNGYHKGACLIYLLLSNQIEAEDMNESWG